jgi:hypothetical protein
MAPDKTFGDQDRGRSRGPGSQSHGGVFGTSRMKTTSPHSERSEKKRNQAYRQKKERFHVQTFLGAAKARSSSVLAAARVEGRGFAVTFTVWTPAELKKTWPRSASLKSRLTRFLSVARRTIFF